MNNIILACLLSLQLLLSALFGPADIRPVQRINIPDSAAQETRLFWGLIDPELSLWFSRIPQHAVETTTPALWDFSWRGFLAALFTQPIIEEDATHAPQV